MAPNSSTPSQQPASFVSEDNLCGTTLLRLVCRGHTLIAELRSLSEQIPPAFIYAAAAAAAERADVEIAELERGVGGLLNPTAAGGGAKKDAAAGTSAMSPLLQGSSAGAGASSAEEHSSYLFSFFSSKQPATGTHAPTSIAGVAATSGFHLPSLSMMSSGPSAPAAGSSAAMPENEMGGESDKRYQSFLFDFAYLRNPEEYEARIAAEIPAEGGGSESAEELEAEFALTHREILTKFYKLFEGIYKYQLDLSQFATDLAKGYYIQYTVDSVLLDTEGRQLMCEAVHLYGVLLMLMEYYIQGPVRERLVIAFFRYCGKDGSLQYIDEVCKLCRSMGGTHPFPSNTRNKPPLNEEKLFTRFPLPGNLVRNIIGALISDDLYHQSQSFPNFDHRSTRLSRQAAMLYIILFFEPHILHDDEGLMREVVDKFFHDNWVIASYMGMTVDLSVDWGRFPAAKAALDNVLQVTNVRRVHIANAKLIGQCMAELRGYLITGILTDTFVLDNTNDLLNCMRRCNVAIRWRLLHRRTGNKEFSEIICATNPKNTADPKLEGDFAIHVNHVVSAILLTSQLELKLKLIFEDLLDKKVEIWVTCRTKAAERMMELSRYFEGDRTLRSVERNEGLMKWFASMSEEIKSLSCENEEHFTVTGRRIQLCIQALQEIEEFDIVDRDMQVKAVLKETRSLLLQMVRAVSIKDDVGVIVHSISDMTYATDAICHLVPIIQKRVRKDPSNVALLQGLFLKLKSILDAPTVRLKQSKNLVGLNKVTDYYSKVIVSFVRTVLDIVPVTVFAILMEIVDIKERRLLQLPVKVDIDDLLQYSQLDERYKLAMLTHELSIFTEGILAMEKTTIGRDEINPRNLLEDGLRKELVRQCTAALHHNLQLQFNFESLEEHQAACVRSLSTLASRMDGFRSAIEYIQDFIDIPGLLMWGEEVARIIGYNVEQEANKYLLKKVLDFESKYQSAEAPIPNYPRTESDPLCVNFMGRTVSTLLKMTDAQTTIFSRECSGWFLADGHEVCGFRTISLLRRAIGVNGLSGVDRLLSFRILHELHRFVKFFRTTVKKQGVLLEQIRDGLFPEWKIPANDAIGFYASATKKTEMLMMPIMTCLRRVGQAQLLRKMIHNELQTCARVDACKLQHSLSTLNEAIMNDAMVRCRTTNENVLSEEFVNGIHEVRDLIDAMGEGDPISTAFLQIDPLEGLPVLLALFVISYMPKFKYDSDFGALVRSNEGYPIDGWPVVVGMATLLKQFHPSYADSVLAYLGQYVRSSIYSSSSRKQSKKEGSPHLSETATHTLIFACHLCSISKVPRSVLYEKIPQYLIEICAQH